MKDVRATPDLSDFAAAYRTAQDAFWQLIDTAPFGVYAVDADFRIIRVSKGGMPAFEGVDPLIGRDVGEVLHILWPESFASEAVGHFRHTLETGEPYRAAPVVEIRNDRKSLESYDWGIDRVTLADGTHGVLCHFYDLTERVKYEAELNERQRRLDVAYAAADMGAWEVDLATHKHEWSPQVFRLFGADPETDTPDDIWPRCVDPEELAEVEELIESSLEGNAPLDIDYRITRLDGEVRYLTARGEVIRDENDKPTRLMGVKFDITHRKMAEMAVRDNERQLRDVIDNTLAFIGVLKPDGTVVEANRPALQAGQLERKDVVRKLFWDTYWWSYDPAVVDRLKTAVAAAAKGEVIRYDEVVRMAGETFITIEFLLAPVYDDNGELQMLVASGFNITEREEAQAHVRDLMGEINHRSKNLLTLVQIMARQTARGGAEDFIDRFERRVAALADAQDLLVKGTTDRVAIKDLALSQLGHFRDVVGSRIKLTGPHLMIAPHACQAIGMALHELATNAGKYGALSGDTGTVDLEWSIKPGDQAGDRFEIRWVERGGPTVCPPERKGFGSTVIDQLVEGSVNGTAELDFAPEGLRWHMTCPLPHLIARK